jgi:hypothetical protein
MKMEQTVCSETLAFKLQMPVNHPEESIQYSQTVTKNGVLNSWNPERAEPLKNGG